LLRRTSSPMIPLANPSQADDKVREKQEKRGEGLPKGENRCP
jgi:hypothetical protein